LEEETIRETAKGDHKGRRGGILELSIEENGITAQHMRKPYGKPTFDTKNKSGDNTT